MYKEQFPNQEIKNYQEDLSQFESVKEEIINLGLFDKSFINDLNFYMIINYERKNNGEIEDSYVNLHTLEEGKNLILEELPGGLVKNVGIFSEEALEQRKGDIDKALTKKKIPEIETGYHICLYLFLKDIDYKTIFSFRATMVHEVAHAKSLKLIPPPVGENLWGGSDYFDDEKFFNETKKGFLKINVSSETKKEFINQLSSSSFSYHAWSEIYAFIYHREFLRRENTENNKMIQNWDNSNFKNINNPSEVIKEVNKKTGSTIDEYQLRLIISTKPHAVSYILAPFLEKKFKNFNERIKFLESFKK